MISILLPSRGRPDQFKRMVDSAFATAEDPGSIEVICRTDDDDLLLAEYNKLQSDAVRIYTGPRDVLSKYWNECFAKARGDILMHCGDDIIFRSPKWDTAVRVAFDNQPDHILFVHGDDGYWGSSFGTHGFIHRKWAETVGYFVPPYFSSDYNDTWLNDVANMIGRRKAIDILTEHMHFAFGKGPYDQTHIDRLERHNRDNVNQLYADKAQERIADAEKLRKVMN